MCFATLANTTESLSSLIDNCCVAIEKTMQENWHQLIKCFDKTQDYVLATIVATRGSTYRKVGTMMLIDDQGKCTGLLSGGCLEADISLHAQTVLSTQQNKLLTYDLKADADLLWGLGLGCEGAIDILLQPLTRENNHLAFAELIASITDGQSGYYCQYLNVREDARGYFFQHEIISAEDILAHLPIERANVDVEQWLITPITPIFSILLCGAGPDAVPVVDMASQLGWHITLQDHRQEHLQQGHFSACYAKRKLRAENATSDDFNGFDGVIIMTHNLLNDGLLLKQALKAEVGYIGLLGPAGRRDKLLNELSLTASDVQNQVFGPIGLDLGGRSPQAIALSICAQIQQYISQQYQQKHFKSWRC